MNAPAAHDIPEAQALLEQVGLDLQLTEHQLELVARLADIVRAATKTEIAAELTDLDHADAVETLRANGLA